MKVILRIRKFGIKQVGCSLFIENNGKEKELDLGISDSNKYHSMVIAKDWAEFLGCSVKVITI